MTRKQAVTLALLVVMMISTIAPLAQAKLQLGFSISANVQVNISLNTAEASTSATPNISACGGCSGGIIGPG